MHGKRGDAKVNSILQSERVCYITSRTDHLHEHHIYGGANRKVSEANGFKVWLTYDMHNGNNPAAVHNNPNQGWDLKLKQDCQRKYEETHSRSDFMKLVGRNYLED